MGFAVMFVMTISAIATHLIYYQLLVPNRLTFMITVVFILVIAALVQMVEIICIRHLRCYIRLWVFFCR